LCRLRKEIKCHPAFRWARRSGCWLRATEIFPCPYQIYIGAENPTRKPRDKCKSRSGRPTKSARPAIDGCPTLVEKFAQHWYPRLSGSSLPCCRGSQDKAHPACRRKRRALCSESTTNPQNRGRCRFAQESPSCKERTS